MTTHDDARPGALRPGLLALHSNRTETLLETVAAWMQANPLGPLEEEVVLVQSNGMAEWVKMQLAQCMGVCAATRVELPARFMWRTYRHVMGSALQVEHSPMERAALVWRLMHLLPQVMDQALFLPLARVVASNEPLALFQLSTRLADLFDQYQVYRADWLADWQNGNDVVTRMDGVAEALPPEQRWQAEIWRRLLAPLTHYQLAGVRPILHAQVLQRLQEGDVAAHAGRHGLARRVVVFGMSHLPLAALQLLAALARHSQVILALPNPCRFHWADTLDGRQLHWATQRYQPLKYHTDLAHVPLEDVHAFGHPLLSAWGKQGRDFVRQTDGFEQTLVAQGGVQLGRVDLFTDDTPCDAPLLLQIQNSIRDLTSLSELPKKAVATHDQSLVFHVAHSALREVEILHDQLLGVLATNHARDKAIEPSDIVVMVPQIDVFAPAIRAVFGQYARADARYIPFDIADLNAKDNNPLLRALDWLIRLPTMRCTVSELRDFLEVPAVANRLGIELDQIALMMAWCEGANARWGIDEAHRHQLGLGACGDANTMVFALRRMLMGYTNGDYWVDGVDDVAPLGGVPYPDMGGLEAHSLGGLNDVVTHLLEWLALVQTPASPAVWGRRFRDMLATFFEPQQLHDKQTLLALGQALEHWQDACTLSGFDGSLPLPVAARAWLDGLNEPSLNKRFKAGGVTFCNLMPMRAIPFEVVGLLGMNDGDFPRSSRRGDWDLMAYPGQFRPGDRSCQDDDRQLLLEAVLSARQVLYVSWVGNSARDNAMQPPSVLVAQLRDYVAAGWSEASLQALTTHHPLQAFSRRYFEVGSGLHSYAREWRQAHVVEHDSTQEATPVPSSTALPVLPEAISVEQLCRFFKNPARAFFKSSLGVVLDDAQSEIEDDELFDLAGLSYYEVAQTVLDRLAMRWPSSPDKQASIETHTRLLQREVSRCHNEGVLPMASIGRHMATQLVDDLLPVVAAWVHHRQPNGTGLATESAQCVTPLVRMVASRWAEKSKANRLRLGAFLQPWIHSMVAATQGQSFACVTIGLDATLHARAWPADQAAQVLQRLQAIWYQGQHQPLPLPMKTAIAQIMNPSARVSTYEGGYTIAGEVADIHWARLYPDWECLIADGRFETLTQEVYGALIAWINDCVDLIPHAFEASVSTESA